MKLDFSFWTTASTRRKRIYTLIFIFAVAFILTVIGSLIPVSHQDAQQVSNQLNQTLNQHKASGTLPEYIFLNNFSICLVMFIPIIGPIIGFFILFDTGYALSAIAQVQGVPSLLLIFAELLTPVFWIEFIAYSIAISESIWLLRRLLQKRVWELKNTVILIGACAGLLALGAIVETWLISIGV
jgi:stage II sporulation SpoM-like protein